MCYNKEVSITTYIIGIIGCINLYFNLNLKIEAILLAYVIQMQLIEYYIWDNISCNETNIITSKIKRTKALLNFSVIFIRRLTLRTRGILNKFSIRVLRPNIKTSQGKVEQMSIKNQVFR
jgi:hypothetical protein